MKKATEIWQFAFNPPSPSLRATFSSGNRNPLVCFADISPKRGISFQGRKPYNLGGRMKLKQPAERIATVGYTVVKKVAEN